MAMGVYEELRGSPLRPDSGDGATTANDAIARRRQRQRRGSISDGDDGDGAVVALGDLLGGESADGYGAPIRLTETAEWTEEAERHPASNAPTCTVGRGAPPLRADRNREEANRVRAASPNAVAHNGRPIDRVVPPPPQTRRARRAAAPADVQQPLPPPQGQAQPLTALSYDEDEVDDDL